MQPTADQPLEPLIRILDSAACNIFCAGRHSGCQGGNNQADRIHETPAVLQPRVRSHGYQQAIPQPPASNRKPRKPTDASCLQILRRPSALRDAVTLADWAGERSARRVLADILKASQEPARAAEHLVRDGAVRAVKRLTADQTDNYLDVTALLDGAPYWVAGTAYRLIAAQADLVPDGDVLPIGDRILRELDDLKSGKLVDLFGFAESRFQGAVAALGALAGRMNQDGPSGEFFRLSARTHGGRPRAPWSTQNSTWSSVPDLSPQSRPGTDIENRTRKSTSQRGGI